MQPLGRPWTLELSRVGDLEAAARAAEARIPKGLAMLQRGLDRRFPGIAHIDDWQFLAQLAQARALWVGITHLRSLHETCQGSVVWQLNGCWPSISWSPVGLTGEAPAMRRRHLC